MTLRLSPLLEAFVTATNNHDGEALTACFVADAIVHDEGTTHRGHPAIRAWFDDVVRKYRFTIVVTDEETSHDETVLTTQVTGSFPGSPIELRYCFNIGDDKIRGLSIGD
ncbi:MAG TPA: nuclear transport factor 2 family protein [Rariglobus sp.]|nr:nuclear transport factor 2 family protein [Rariglobus sp.]